MTTDTVILRTGIEHHKMLVATLHLTCSDMLDERPFAMFDAVSMARDSNYKPFGNNGDILKSARLLDDNGHMNRSIKEVICAIFEGDMLDMKLLSPAEYLKSDDA